MNISKLAKITNRTERDLIAKLQNDGYLREKTDTSTPAKQTVNHKLDGHYVNTPDGPDFDDEISNEIKEKYTLPQSNRARSRITQP